MTVRAMGLLRSGRDSDTIFILCGMVPQLDGSQEQS